MLTIVSYPKDQINILVPIVLEMIGTYPDYVGDGKN